MCDPKKYALSGFGLKKSIAFEFGLKSGMFLTLVRHWVFWLQGTTFWREYWQICNSSQIFYMQVEANSC